MTHKDSGHHHKEHISENIEDILEEIPEETPTDTATSTQSDQKDTEITKLKEQLARANADMQNMLRRFEQERNEMSAYFTEQFVKKLLPTIDNIERVVTGTPEELKSGAVYEGVKQAFSGLEKMLENMGITSFPSLGEDLDPNKHEALSQWVGPEGKIIAEFEKGYTLKEKVIRHAKVVVGNGTEQ